MNYNYVYFNTNYLDNGRIDKNEYNSICVRDLNKLTAVQVVPAPLDYAPRFIRRLYNWTILISKKTNKKIYRVWFRFLYRSKFSNDKPLCFIISSYNLPLDYFVYLRKSHKDCKIIKIYRDLVSAVSRVNNEYSAESASKVFDLCMTYDDGDALKYNFLQFDEIESKIQLIPDKSYPWSDVFFAGKVKDRFEKILKAYDIFEKIGLKCDFYLTGVEPNKRIERKGIVYANRQMPYIEMLKKSINTRCMFDVNQGKAQGYTSRFLEAVMYNKKLITDNQRVKSSKFYNPNFIQVVDQVNDINPYFVTNETVVNYQYNNEFSPIFLVNQIEDYLSAKTPE